MHVRTQCLIGQATRFMELKNACHRILTQLEEVVAQLSAEEFRTPVRVLNQSTIGQHVRHTLEFFICLEEGIAQGSINYDNRKHDKTIENDKSLTLSKINEIKAFINQKGKNHSLKLHVNYDMDNTDSTTIPTSYLRELAYNLEHAVHHMAIMKIGLKELKPDIIISPSFGIAVSTLRYQEKEKTEKVLDA